MKNVVILLTVLLIVTPAYAEETIVFTGIPEIKISESGTSRVPENLSKSKSIEYKCTITKIDDKYYWTTRENTLLVPISSGAYLTFWAVNGSGYVRIIDPEMKSVVSMLDETGKEFDYVEHLLLGLTSVTYYGKLE